MNAKYIPFNLSLLFIPSEKYNVTFCPMCMTGGRP